MQGYNIFGQVYANQRTEDDILAQNGVLLTFNGEFYSAKPLRIKANAEWRRKFAETVNEVNQSLSLGSMDDINKFMLGFMGAFFEFPEKVLDLIVAYAPYLPWDQIREAATDEEVVIAFSRIMVVAYPFFGLLGTMKAMASAASAHTNQVSPNGTK